MPTFSAEAIAALAKVTQPYNGEDTYSNDKAMYGYIDADKYMYVSVDYLTRMNAHWSNERAPAYTTAQMGRRMAYSKLKNDNPVVTTYMANKPYLVYGNTADEELDLSKMQFANYFGLLAAGYSPVDAFIAAGLRTRWMALGCLYTESDDCVSGNNSPFDETIVMTATPTEGASPLQIVINKILQAKDMADFAKCFDNDDALNAYQNAVEHGETGISWILGSAEAIWAIVEYFFRTRGHHWKDEYVALATKMFNSGFEGNRDLPGTLAPDVVFRVAIHPFGVMQLPRMAYHFALCAKLGNSFLLRLEAAPNGLAVVTTSAAALDCLRTEAWWSAFYANMRDSIELVTSMAKEILADKYSYHMSGNLYGANKKTILAVDSIEYTIEEAKARASPIATVVEGFISYLERQVDAGVITSYSLRNAKALKKHSSSNPSLSIKVTILCELVAKVLSDTTEMKTATRAVFPELTPVEVQREAITNG
jgi:hypothetical protein